MKKDILFLPVLQLNNLCVTAFIPEKNLTIGHFNCRYSGLLVELRYCNTQHHNLSTYVQQLRACVAFFRLFYQRHGNVDARCADVSMIGRDQHSHIINFHPQINYLHGTDNGRAVCPWISSYKELKPTGNLIERHYFARTLYHLYSRHRCHRFLPDYSCIFVDVISVLRWRPRLPRNIIYSRFEGGIKPQSSRRQ